MENKPSYFAIIPANIRYDKDLTANAKLLYGEITALCNHKGYCWASNDYFAKLYDISNRTISRWISQLIKKEYIYSDIIYEEGTKEVKERHLYIVHIPIDKNVTTYRQKCPKGIDKSVKDNNKGFNNTVNKGTHNIFQRRSYTDDQLEKYYTDPTKDD